ncbi:PKD domain-containing protein [Aquipuribacter nitratireducens]|uniref:PKD domain-containing protein n=1 Tax=Aquipuribacter nitratireducens TaxID=650104 RepID=A0ABW0GSK4_9MICO
MAGAALTVLAVAASALVASVPAAGDTVPPPGTPATVAADALPTVQVNGVVWSQAVIGDRVWAAGSFTTARPAGSAPGQNEVDRRNVLVYDIRTGQRDTTFTEWLNATGHVVAASPDGRRVYVGGDFTSASGVRHERIVAFDAVTGRAVHAFDAHLDARVSAIAATNDTVYVGGSFLSANGVPRTRLAAFRASDGALLDWAPTAQDQPVQALTLTRDGSRLYVGGKFLGLNGNGVKGLGALDPVTGSSLPVPAAAVIRNGGERGGITSLAVDGDTLYGTGFTFGSLAVGNLEGVFAARAGDGQLTWVADCHGDHYSVAPVGDTVYAAGHAHYCGNVGSFGQTTPWRFDRALAFSTQPKGTLLPNSVDSGRYFDFGGLPRPDALHWYPYMDAGTYTGQNQGPWSVTGNADYVAFGGEFTEAMNIRQQGLVRFARHGLRPEVIGPQSSASLTPVLDTLEPGSVRVAWQTSWDYDNRALTYRVVRNGQVSAPVHTVTVDSASFDRPYLSFTDTDVVPGQTYAYRVYVRDGVGNENRGNTVTTTVAGGTALTSYPRRVRADGAQHLWRLGEASGPVKDRAGGDDLTLSSGATRQVPGAVVGDPDGAVGFSGTSTGSAASSGAVMGPQVFSVEAWVRTSSTAGGKIVGFGNQRTGNSQTFDRHLYVDSGGRVGFGVYPGASRVLRSATAVVDGQWHHVVGTLGTDGQKLYVDGALVAQNAATTSATPVTGYWRVGGDNLSGWPNRPASDYLDGQVDEVAVYHSVLTPQTVATHHALGLGQLPANQSPTASFTTTTSDLRVTVDGRASSDPDGTVASYAWAFGDGTTASGPTAIRTYAAPGTYTVTLTVTDDAGATAQTSRQVTVTAPPPPPPGNRAPTASFTTTVSGLAVSADGRASSDPDGTVTAWAWDFGDGAVAAGATTGHTYAAAGTYTIRLTVTDDDGATHSTTRQVTLTAPAVRDRCRRVVVEPVQQPGSSGWCVTDAGRERAKAGGG